MRKALALLIALLVGSFTLLEAQDAQTAHVYSIVLDKTMSMTGHGGTNIWPEVQRYCNELVDGIPQSSTVLLFTFDKDLYGPQKFDIRSATDKESIKTAIKDIIVDGKNTYIASNLSKNLDYIYENYPDLAYNRIFYLITDGIEEEAGSSFNNVLQKYSLKRGQHDYLYYVDLRDLAPKEIKEAIQNTKGAGLGSGFAKFLTISPVYPSISYTIGKSDSITQHFLVSNEELLAGIKLSVKVDSVAKTGDDDVNFNVDLSPSASISKKNMEKVEDGKYKVNFNVNFFNTNGTPCESDIFVSLSGQSQSNVILDIEPSVFCIKSRHTPKGKLTVTMKGFDGKCRQGDSLVKSIMELDFDEQAKDDNAYVTWDLVGDWNKFDYSFSQGELKDHALTINANDYKKYVDGSEGIVLTIKGKPTTEEGKYNLSMKAGEQSNNLEIEPRDASLDMRVNYFFPTPIWKTLLLVGGIILALALIIFALMQATAKFPGGLLQLNNKKIELKGKKKISIKDELKDMGIALSDGTEIVLVRKRFTAFQGPCVKELTGCYLICNGAPLTQGKIIRRNQDVRGLKDTNGNPVNIRYC